MSGAQIAAEVAAALAEAGAEVGTGAPLYCTLKRPGNPASRPSQAHLDGAPSYHELVAVQDMRAVRDDAGIPTGDTRAVLMIEATGIAPRKSDLIAVGIRPGSVDAATRFADIAKITTVAPGGVPVLYEVELAD